MLQTTPQKNHAWTAREQTQTNRRHAAGLTQKSTESGQSQRSTLAEKVRAFRALLSPTAWGHGQQDHHNEPVQRLCKVSHCLEDAGNCVKFKVTSSNSKKAGSFTTDKSIDQMLYCQDQENAWNKNIIDSCHEMSSEPHTEILVIPALINDVCRLSDHQLNSLGGAEVDNQLNELQRTYKEDRQRRGHPPSVHETFLVDGHIRDPLTCLATGHCETMENVKQIIQSPLYSRVQTGYNHSTRQKSRALDSLETIIWLGQHRELAAVDVSGSSRADSGVSEGTASIPNTRATRNHCDHTSTANQDKTSAGKAITTSGNASTRSHVAVLPVSDANGLQAAADVDELCASQSNMLESRISSVLSHNRNQVQYGGVGHVILHSSGVGWCRSCSASVAAVPAQVACHHCHLTISSPTTDIVALKDQSHQHCRHTAALKDQSHQHCRHTAALKDQPHQHCRHTAALKDQPHQHCRYTAALKDQSHQHCRHTVALKDQSHQHCRHTAALKDQPHQPCHPGSWGHETAASTQFSTGHRQHTHVRTCEMAGTHGPVVADKAVRDQRCRNPWRQTGSPRQTNVPAEAAFALAGCSSRAERHGSLGEMLACRPASQCCPGYRATAARQTISIKGAATTPGDVADIDDVDVDDGVCDDVDVSDDVGDYICDNVGDDMYDDDGVCDDVDVSDDVGDYICDNVGDAIYDDVDVSDDVGDYICDNVGDAIYDDVDVSDDVGDYICDNVGDAIYDDADTDDIWDDLDAGNATIVHKQKQKTTSTVQPQRQPSHPLSSYIRSLPVQPGLQTSHPLSSYIRSLPVQPGLQTARVLPENTPAAPVRGPLPGTPKLSDYTSLRSARQSERLSARLSARQSACQYQWHGNTLFTGTQTSGGNVAVTKRILIKRPIEEESKRGKHTPLKEGEKGRMHKSKRALEMLSRDNKQPAASTRWQGDIPRPPSCVDSAHLTPTHGTAGATREHQKHVRNVATKEHQKHVRNVATKEHQKHVRNVATKEHQKHVRTRATKEHLNYVRERRHSDSQLSQEEVKLLRDKVRILHTEIQQRLQNPENVVCGAKRGEVTGQANSYRSGQGDYDICDTSSIITGHDLHGFTKLPMFSTSTPLKQTPQDSRFPDTYGPPAQSVPNHANIFKECWAYDQISEKHIAKSQNEPLNHRHNFDDILKEIIADKNHLTSNVAHQTLKDAGFASSSNIARHTLPGPSTVGGSNQPPHMNHTDSLHEPGMSQTDSLHEPDMNQTDSLREPDMNHTDKLHEPYTKHTDSLHEPGMNQTDSLREPGMNQTDSLLDTQCQGSATCEPNSCWNPVTFPTSSRQPVSKYLMMTYFSYHGPAGPADSLLVHLDDPKVVTLLQILYSVDHQTRQSIMIKVQCFKAWQSHTVSCRERRRQRQALAHTVFTSWQHWAREKHGRAVRALAMLQRRRTLMTFKLWLKRVRQIQETDRRHRVAGQRRLLLIIHKWQTWATTNHKYRISQRLFELQRSQCHLMSCFFVWKSLTEKVQKIRSQRELRLKYSLLMEWQQIVKQSKSDKHTISHFVVYSNTRWMRAFFQTWHVSYRKCQMKALFHTWRVSYTKGRMKAFFHTWRVSNTKRRMLKQEWAHYCERCALAAAAVWRRKAQETRGARLKSVFLKHKMASHFQRWKSSLSLRQSLYGTLDAWTRQKEASRSRQCLRRWRTLVMAERAGRAYICRLLHTVMVEWRSWATVSKMRRIKSLAMKRKMEARRLCAVFQYWRAQTRLTQYVQHSLETTLLTRTLRCWKLHTRRMCDLRKLQDMFARHTETRLTRSVFRSLRQRADHCTSLEEMAHTVTRDKTLAKIRALLATWRHRFHEITSFRYHQHILAVRGVRRWRRFVCTRKLGRLQDEQKWRAASDFHHQNICKRVFSALKLAVKVARWTEQRRHNLCLRYADLWKSRADMGATALLVEREASLRRAWGSWRHRQAQAQASQRVDQHLRTVLLSQVFAVWRDLRRPGHSAAMSAASLSNRKQNHY